MTSITPPLLSYVLGKTTFSVAHQTAWAIIKVLIIQFSKSRSWGTVAFTAVIESLKGYVEFTK